MILAGRTATTTEAPRVLILRIEPTGYMIALVRALRAAWPGRIDAVFVSPSMTQHWAFDSIRDDIVMLPVGTVRSIYGLRAHIDATSPRLIHTAGWGAPQSAAAIFLGSSRDVPVVVDLDTWRGSSNPWHGAAKRFVLPRLFRRVTHFAPGGRPQADYLRRCGVPDGNITPVNMTVDVASIRSLIAAGGTAARAAFRNLHGIAQEAVVALFVGRLVALKGIGTILAVWRQIRDRHAGAFLAIVGDGDMRGLVEAGAVQDPRIRVIGHMPADEVWRAYAAADFLVGASRVEPWGLVVNEAMAADLPVVVTDAFGCTADLLRHGETGFVVPVGDTGALANALERLIADGALRRAMASKAHDLITGWTIENQAKNITQVWTQALSSVEPAGE